MDFSVILNIAHNSEIHYQIKYEKSMSWLINAHCNQVVYSMKRVLQVCIKI